MWERMVIECPWKNTLFFASTSQRHNVSGLLGWTVQVQYVDEATELTIKINERFLEK
jgi:hypothetical protein